MNPRPLGTRKTIRVLIALTILVWATQTLIHQWGYGAEVNSAASVSSDSTAALTEGGEKFVPAPGRAGPAITVELRSEARVLGSEIRLKQICRWSKTDAPAFVQVGDLVIGHFDNATPFKTISLDEVRQTLHDAGVNVAIINFAGTTQCTVSRADVEYDQTAALDQWIAARQPAPASAPAAPASAPGAPALAQSAPAPSDAATPVRSLRDLLTADLAVRLSVPAEQLQINFNPADQKLLNLSEPQFKFNLEGRFIHNLGDVSWDVEVVTDNGSRKATIAAIARAWQNQVLLMKPLVFGQQIQQGDVSERRVLADQLPTDPLLAAAQVVGQQAARDLQPGTVFTPALVQAVPLAAVGQFITVTLNQGSVRIKTVAKALEGGSYGQTIRVKNEANEEIYQVVLTAPQEATMGPLATGMQARVDER